MSWRVWSWCGAVVGRGLGQRGEGGVEATRHAVGAHQLRLGGAARTSPAEAYIKQLCEERVEAAELR